MTARVLVVDDILANVRLLEAKLAAEYFEVVTAMNGMDALEAVKRSKPDIVLLDVMMPGIDGIEVCKRIKADPAAQHIPVVMVTALDQPEDRVRGLEAGADDFLTKPVNDISLFCRIKSLVRLKMLQDELRVRAVSSESIGLMVRVPEVVDNRPGNVMLVDTRASSSERIISALAGQHTVRHVDNPQDAATLVAEASEPFELIIVNLDPEKFDGLRLCSHLKSMEATRQVPILIIVDPDDQNRLLRALDMGVNDYLMRPIDKQELMARVQTQIKRWRYTERLRSSVKASIEMSVTDPLTGLYNRRYMHTHLAHLVEHSNNRGKPLALISMDVDHFKAINDTYGHDAGDRVLQELAERIRRNTRNVDMCCRVGGEEFIVVLPNSDMELTRRVAERLRRTMAGRPFPISSNDSQGIPVTVSLGLAVLNGPGDMVEDLLKRADMALYEAKRQGRNRVIAAAA
ncbi:MAG TPA: PleD family two-component system response regulator [Aestuariivirga sp.]|jgi:two-component system cell cycle response regulator|nr:PleD family two-component system response regulator [Aestuariivirga sp.]